MVKRIVRWWLGFDELEDRMAEVEERLRTIEWHLSEDRRNVLPFHGTPRDGGPMIVRTH